MEALLIALVALACPLGMLAVGGVVWVMGRTGGEGSRRRFAYRCAMPSRHRSDGGEAAGEPQTTASEDEVHHPLFARFYTRMSPRAERRGQAEHRRELLAGLDGRVVEVGCGNGLNFAHYPVGVSELVAIEPEPYLRERAAEAAAEAPVPVRVLPGLAEELPAGDASFDAGVASLLLCSEPDPDRALAELHRVIRPGRELRFYEHVVSGRRSLAALERAFTAAVWKRVSGGCHLDRNTTAAIERAGFEIERRDRFPFSPLPFPPRVSHVLGVGRRSQGTDERGQSSGR